MKKITICGIIIIVLLTLFYLIFGSPTNLIREHKLKQAITALSDGEVCINDVVPFDWDDAYSFTPYTTKEQIEAEIGIKSSEITETYNESQINLLFVKDNRIVAGISGSPSKLGCCFDSPWHIRRGDNAVFTVECDSFVNLSKNQ